MIDFPEIELRKLESLESDFSVAQTDGGEVLF